MGWFDDISDIVGEFKNLKDEVAEEFTDLKGEIDSSVSDIKSSVGEKVSDVKNKAKSSIGIDGFSRVNNPDGKTSSASKSTETNHINGDS